ncbi:MAG: hypothetical protein ACKVXR_10780 [Planctomycetota bacterium]
MTPVRVSWARIALAASALAALFAISHQLLRGRILATWQGVDALAPLYAFAEPVLRPQALVFLVLAVAVALVAPRIVDPERTSRASFAGFLAAASVLLPLALHLVRGNLADLGAQFDVYQHEEFLHDARAITNLPAFLDRYVELMPTLSLHGQHFPPGHAVLLHLAGRAFGPGTLAAGLLVLAFAAIGVHLAWRAFVELAEDRAARQGALLLLAAPSLLDFSATAMDAVFFAFAALAWWLSLRNAWLAGGALLLATFFSFSALPVGLAIGLHAVLRGRLGDLPKLFAAYVACAGLLFAALGFPIWSCLLEARRSNTALMANAIGADPASLWPSLSLGNATAILLGAGMGLVAAATRGRFTDPLARASLLALLAMSLGGIYFLETERIWLFALPWLAAVAISAGSLDDRSLRRVIAAGFVQALLMETALFTLW